MDFTLVSCALYSKNCRDSVKYNIKGDKGVTCVLEETSTSNKCLCSEYITKHTIALYI